MTSRTDSRGRMKVALSPGNWIGIVGTALLMVAGAALSQVFINTRHDAAIDERQVALDKKLDATAGVIERENTHTREVLRIEADATRARVSVLEGKVDEIDRIIRPPVRGGGGP